MKQAPKIESPSKQYGVKGDTLRLECVAFSVPKARHISWSFNGNEINTMSDRDYSILEDPSSARQIKSTLIIRDSQDWHFGKYNCTVVNDYGVDVLQIDLLYQCKKCETKETFFLFHSTKTITIFTDNFQFLMITVGAALIVIILVILVVLFLCCKLKRKTNQQSNDEKLRYSDDDLTVIIFATSRFDCLFYCSVRFRNIKFRIDAGKKVMVHHIVAIISLILSKVLLNQIIRLHRLIVLEVHLTLKSVEVVAFLLLDLWIFLLATGKLIIDNLINFTNCVQ